MYLTRRSTTASPVTPEGDIAVARPLPRLGVSRNVVALGAVSMVTDISSEMVTAVLPLYFVFVLGMTPVTFGFLDGLYNGVTAIVQIAAGHAADRWQKRKSVAATGYGLSAVCKLGLLAAGSVVPTIAIAIGADRTGKGIRTAPRDALISLSSDVRLLGRSFGVHRALDTVGALLGPLAAFFLLARAPGRYDAVFVVSFCIAAFGVLLLLASVREPKASVVVVARPSFRDSVSLLRNPRILAVTACAIALSLTTISDAFVYLLVQRRFDLSLTWFPLLPLATSVSYMALSIPLGRLADRIGRLPVFLCGYLPLLAVYLLVLAAPAAGGIFVAIFLLHGLYYAATNGVLMAHAGTLVPAHLRASGMAILQTGTATAALASSVLFGGIWAAWGPRRAVECFAVALAAVLVVGAMVLGRRGVR